MSTFLITALVIATLACIIYCVVIAKKDPNNTTIQQADLKVSSYLSTLKSVLDKALHRNDIPK